MTSTQRHWAIGAGVGGLSLVGYELWKHRRAPHAAGGSRRHHHHHGEGAAPTAAQVVEGENARGEYGHRHRQHHHHEEHDRGGY